tara:strand:+ start:1043 stop:1456 length:414 start_codon:yes stop_codon:yes gene_type:complete
MKNKKTYMEMAVIWAQNSKAKRKKVGCLIVKDNRIISDGYNGTPTGLDNCCEEYCNEHIGLITKREVLHAESNAITKLAASTMSSEGSSLFTTLSPCFDCAKLIIQSGIKEVYYLEEYNDPTAQELLKSIGIKFQQL